MEVSFTAGEGVEHTDIVRNAHSNEVPVCGTSRQE
jgi:endo-beta-N-acetylglucosaminidase D